MLREKYVGSLYSSTSNDAAQTQITALFPDFAAGAYVTAASSEETIAEEATNGEENAGIVFHICLIYFISSVLSVCGDETAVLLQSSSLPVAPKGISHDPWKYVT